MAAIEEIEQRLKEYPHLKYRISDNSITIDAPSGDGFSVSLLEGNSEWIIGFDGWHEHFDTKDEALNYFAFGLSGKCRLEITLRGSFPYRWTVQSRTNNGWQTDSTTGLLVYPFWRRKHVEYRQNDVASEHD
jgi:hypothetical protein